jgi:hypothetical protein
MLDRKLLSAAAFVAALAGGGVAGAVIGTPALLGAQEDTTTTTTAADTTTTTGESGGESTDDAERERRCGKLIGARLEAAAEAIGISVDELRDALADGSSIAEVAEANDVDPQTVIDALVADANERIDEAVANGRITEDEAAERRAELAERVADLVNGELRFGGPGGLGRGRW